MKETEGLEEIKQEAADATGQEGQGEKQPEEKQSEEKQPEEKQPAGKKLSRKTVGWLTAGGAAFVIIAALIIGYFAVANHYKTHFLPGSTMNGMRVDGMSAEEAATLLEKKFTEYELAVTGRNGEVLGVLTDEDVSLRVTGAVEGVEGALSAQAYLKWPLAKLGRLHGGHDILCGQEFDSDQAVQKLAAWEALDETKAVLPEDAYISEYLPEKKAYEIMPETKGTALDSEKVAEHVLAALEAGETAVSVEDCYTEAEVTAQNPKLVRTLEALNRMVSTELTLDWNGSEVILDGDTIHEWIVEESHGGFVLDEDAVTEFVKEQSRKYDTYGKHRYFTTALGETIYVRNGGYGWKVDVEKETAALVELIQQGAVEEREPIFWVTGMQKGTEDIGSSYVEIDLTHQHLYLFWKGQIVLETDFVSGDVSKGNTTPGGLFRLTYRATDAVLRGRDYVTPVKYWMPFNGNIGMHDATWRSEFGGEIYLTNGSHGCINLPLDMAEAIFGYINTGFPIICYYY